ncbi:MAG: carboxypeptidase-like regulatory domain-containing protein [Janthinobacterium lividum]
MSKLTVLLLWLLGLPAFGQEAQVLRGLVLDADTHQPIPNAQVGIAGNKLGTSTNPEGRFALRVPAAYAGTELEVALLGYRRYVRPLPPLPGPELRVELKISPASLGTVAVSSSVTSIIKEAVARIPRNYPTRTTHLTGFFRESDDNVTSHEYYYLGEALLLVQKAPYQHPHDDGQVKILEIRKVDLRLNRPGGSGSLVPLNWIAGSFIPHRFDFVHNRPEFLRASHFKDYQYRLTPQTSFQGRPVYVIAFGPRPGTDRADFAGQLYIDEQSYAFLGASWHRTPSGIRREGVLLFEASERTYLVDYQRYAGRWYLKSVWYNTLGKPIGGQTRRHLAEFITTAIDTTQNQAITYVERAQYGDVFLHAAAPYDSTFWNHYTTLLPPTQLRLDLLDQERQRQAERLLRAPVVASPAAADTTVIISKPVKKSWLTRIRYTYGLGLLPVQGPLAALGVAVAPAGYSFRAAATADARAQAVAGSYGLGVQVDLVKNFSVYGLTRSAFGGLQGLGWEAGLGWEINLNPRHRPLHARLGVAYLRQTLGRDLGTFDNPDDGLRLAGTKLSADRLTLALQSQTEGLQPRLGLGLELSHQWEATADLGYLWPLRTRTRLYAEEDKWFFGNETTLDLPASEVQLTVAGQPATAAPWQLGRLQLNISLVHRFGR